MKGRNQQTDPTNEKTPMNDNKSFGEPIVQECKNQNFLQKRQQGVRSSRQTHQVLFGGTKYWLLISGARVTLQRWAYCGGGGVLRVTQRPNPKT